MRQMHDEVDPASSYLTATISKCHITVQPKLGNTFRPDDVLYITKF